MNTGASQASPPLGSPGGPCDQGHSQAEHSGPQGTRTADSELSDASRHLTLPCSPRCHRCMGWGPLGARWLPAALSWEPDAWGC